MKQLKNFTWKLFDDKLPLEYIYMFDVWCLSMLICWYTDPTITYYAYYLLAYAYATILPIILFYLSSFLPSCVLFS